MQKIMKTVDFKIALRDKEIAEADRIAENDKYVKKHQDLVDEISDDDVSESSMDQEDQSKQNLIKKEKDKLQKKPKVEKLDPFFAPPTDETVEKRVV